MDLDAPIGRYFCVRNLVECGETWARLTPPNVPKQADTVVAMRALCVAVLDPAHEQFGALVLTYGFASRALTRLIRGRIAPSLDQHAGAEVDDRGGLICPRRGFAADFQVAGTSSATLARWIVRNASFDRLYYYGPDRPLHVSVGPEHTRACVVKVGRMPRALSESAFLRALES